MANDAFKRFRDDVEWAASRAGDGREEAHTGLGDPTRWGASGSLQLSALGPAYNMGQLIRVQAADPYPRNWQMLGTLTVSPELAASPNSDDNWGALLQIVMGTGQTVVTHNINLRALINLAFDPSLIPLSWYVPVLEGDRAVLPWILPGGLIGQVVNARILVQLNVEAPFSVPQTVDATAIISPYAVGHGL